MALLLLEVHEDGGKESKTTLCAVRGWITNAARQLEYSGKLNAVDMRLECTGKLNTMARHLGVPVKFTQRTHTADTSSDWL